MPHDWTRVSPEDGTTINRRRYWECKNCMEIYVCLEGIPDSNCLVLGFKNQQGTEIYMTCEEIQARNIHAS